MDLIIGQMREEADYHLHRAFSDDELAPPGIPFSIEDLAHIVGLEPPELFARFHQGENLLQIAREQGFSRQQLLEAIMELARHREKSLVDQGAIRPNDVERYLRHFLQEVEEQIEEVSPPRDGPHEEPPITPEDVAAILGINLEELLAYFEGGGTFQELAKRHEMTVEELVGKIVHKARQRLAYLVDEDKLSPMEAREILEKLKKDLLQEINDSDKSPIAPPKPTPGELVAIPFDYEALARALGMSPRELQGLLSEGYTLEDVAKKQGTSLNDLVDILIRPMRDKLRQMVEADRIDEGQARDMLAKMRERLLRTLEEFQVPRHGETRPDHREYRPDPSDRPYPEIPLTLGDAARILGISVEEMIERMEVAEDIRELLAERGLTIEQFIRALYNVVGGRLENEVARGELSKEKAGHILAELKQRLFQDLAGVHPVAPKPITPEPLSEDTFAGHADIPFNLEQIAHSMGLSPDELRRLLSQGHSLAEVADKLDISLEELVDPLIATVEAKIIGLVSKGYLSEKLAREALEQAREKLEHELDRSWRALEEEHRSAWDDLEEEHRSAWEGLDQEYQRGADTLDEAQQMAWHALDEEYQVAREALDVAQQRTWERLDEAHRRAWNALQSEHEEYGRALDEECQVAFAALAKDDSEARAELEQKCQVARDGLQGLQEKAWDGLENKQREFWQALQQEHQVAWETLDRRQEAARDALDQEHQRAWQLLDRNHQDDWRALDLNQLVARHTLDQAELEGRRALEERHREAYQDLEGGKREVWQALDEAQQAARHALEEPQQATRQALDKKHLAARHALADVHQRAWEASDQEHRKAWEALEQRHRLAQNALNQEHQEAWQALDEQYRAALAALEGGSEQARIELEEKCKRARQVLELAQQKAWQALDEEHQRAYQALNEVQKPFRHALEQRHQATWLALDEQHRRAWQALEEEHQRAWQALEEEHRRAWEELEQEHSTSTSLFQKPSCLFPDLALDKQQFARALGLSLEELGRFVSQGYTVAEIAQKRGISIEALVGAVVAFPRAKIRRLVAEDRLGEEEAVRLLREIRGQIVQMIRTFSPPSPSTVPITSTDGVPESTTTEGSSNTGIVAPDGSTTFSAGR